MTREEAIKKIKEAMPTLWKETKEAIQVLVPELCENDNERIRKDIINYIGFEKPIADKDENRIKKMITYFERQKEQDKCPEYCVRSHCIGCSIYENQKEQKEKNLRDFIDNFPYSEKQKEQNLEKMHVVTRDFTSTDAIESCMLCYLQSAANRKDDIEIIEDTKKYKKQLLEIVKQKEQKTTYWNPTEEDVKLFNKAVITNTCLTPQEKAKLDIIRTKFKHRPYIVTTECIEFDNEFKNQVSHLITSILNGEHSYSRDFVEWVSQQLLGYAKNEMKTTEWSEEDETEIKRTIGLIEGWMNTFKETYYATDCKKSISWLKSLRPQPKQEWSEEDETHRAFILESLEDQIRFCKKDAEGAYYAKQIRTAQNWLKSLRPKPKQEWSDKDDHILNNIYDFVAENTIDINRARCAKECLDWLKSLRPQQKQELTEEEKNKYVFDTLCALGYPIDANGNIIKYEEVFEMCQNTMVYWLQQNLQKMIATKMVDSEGIKTQTLLKESYLKAYREGIEDSIRELLLQYNKKSSQPSWKPTEEQIKAIRLARSFVVDDFSEKPTLSETLKELEEQLKKL